MNTLNRNRLIGGGVLLLAALLFLPGILHPEHNELDNPDLAVHLNNDAKLAKKKANAEANSATQPQTAIVLASSDDITPVAETKRSNKNLMPIALESSPEEPVVTTPKNKPKQQHLNRWLQIDGFKSDRAALNAANQMEDKHLSTQLRMLSVNGKESHQVLVGPFKSSKALQTAMQAIKQLGYKAKIK